MIRYALHNGCFYLEKPDSDFFLGTTWNWFQAIYIKWIYYIKTGEIYKLKKVNR